MYVYICTCINSDISKKDLMSFILHVGMMGVAPILGYFLVSRILKHKGLTEI